MNMTTLKGYVVGEPQIKATNGGLTIIDFSISVRARFKKDSEDSSKKHSSFFNCTCFPKDLGDGSIQREIAKVVKGNLIAFDAEPIQERWEHDGQKRSKVSFNVDGFIDVLYRHNHDHSTPDVDKPTGNTPPPPLF